MKDLHELAWNALRQLAGKAGSGLEQESEPHVRERLIGVEKAGDKIEIRIASDGLSLNHKALIEQELRQYIQAMDPDVASRLLIYFKRKTPLGPGHSGGVGGLITPQRTAGAFGLKLDKRAIPGVREVIAVASGKGGVGKSTVSVNLAVALAQSGKRVGLLDADLYGPSAPLMMGLKGPMAVSADAQLVPQEKFGVKVVSFGFLADSQNPVIWRGPVVSKALRQLCFETAWGDLDYLIIDFPPGTGDVQLTLIESIPIHKAVIVSTPQDVALLDAHKGLTMFEKLDVPVLGIVENMAYHICRQCGHTDHIFGHEAMQRFASERKLPVIAQIPLLLEIRQGADAGLPPALDKFSALGRPFYELSSKIMVL